MQGMSGRRREAAAEEREVATETENATETEDATETEIEGVIDTGGVKAIAQTDTEICVFM